MQTDRELLELAAKAAGLLYAEVFDDANGKHVIHYVEGKGRCLWSSLEDDGDAMRLAVMLGMIVVIQDSGFVCAEIPGFDPVGEYEWSAAATRRAITRAAAQMQLSNKSK